MADVASTPSDLRLVDLTIVETPVTISILKARQAERAAQALSRAFGETWPSRPNGVTAAEPRIAWLAPGEWAIFQPAGQISNSVAAACQGLVHHLADVSAGRRLWRIGRGQARALLAKGCSLDTDPRVFPPGRSAQTLLAQVPVLLIPELGRSGAPMFEVVADASLAGWLRAWFADAAQEFQS